MKKILFIVCLVFAVAAANAQGFSVGVRGGLNFSKETVSGSGTNVSFDSRTSILLGGYAKIMLPGKIGIQPELFYSAMGAKQGSDVERLNYLSLPVFFRYNVTDNVHFLVGPQISMLLSAKDIVSGQPDQDIKDQLNSSDFSGVAGIGVDFGPFNAGVRYTAGLSNIAKNTTGGFSVKNSAFQLVAGFKLFGK